MTVEVPMRTCALAILPSPRRLRPISTAPNASFRNATKRSASSTKKYGVIVLKPSGMYIAFSLFAATLAGLVRTRQPAACDRKTDCSERTEEQQMAAHRARIVAPARRKRELCQMIRRPQHRELTDECRQHSQRHP